MKRTPRLLAAAAYAAATVALLGSATSAIAGPVPTPVPTPSPAPSTSHPASLVDPAAGVQLDIHKYLGRPDPTKTPDGTQQTVTGATPLSGVVYDVYQVYYAAGPTNPVDLTTNAGWEAAAAITGVIPTRAEITARQFTIDSTTYYLGSPTAVTTYDNGTAYFSKPAGAGLYLVNENVTASTSIKACPTESTCSALSPPQFSPSYPFFVTLPMTDPVDGNTWMYEVHVYPKNQPDVAQKTVVDEGTSSSTGESRNGDHTLVYTVATPITDGLSAAEMGRYEVRDPLDYRLTLVPGDLTVKIDPDGDLSDATDQVTLVPTTDYTFTYGDLSGTDPRLLTVTLTPAGIAKLVHYDGLDSAATVVTTIPATVASTGTIANLAYVIPNQGYYDQNIHGCTPTTSNPCYGIPTNATPTDEWGTPVESKYGDVIVTKLSKPGSNELKGATFAVYLDRTQGSPCTAADVVTGPGNPILATGTTGNDGTVMISGLQASDFYNGQTQAEADWLRYCLVETAAPTGYNLNSQPREFHIMQADLTSTGVTAYDEQTNLGNRLPLTGGEGVAALSLAGLALVGGGLGYYLVTARRRTNGG